MTPLIPQEEFEAGKGPAPLRKETHHWAGEVGFPQRKSWCAHPARGCVCSEMSPCGQDASAGAAFPAAQGSPLVMPLCSPGRASHARRPPATLAGCQLAPVHGNPPWGRLRGSGKAVSCSWGVAAAPVHHGKLPASSESGVRQWLFFCHVVIQPLLV